MKKSLIFTGGGTAGHVYPGLAVIKIIREQYKIQIYWLGTKRGIEKQLVKEEAIPFIRIPAGKLRRYFSIRNIIDLFKFICGIFCSLVILFFKKPILLFSKGGYVSVPPVIAAKLLKIPVITHESDYDPGLATKINARIAEKILVSYNETIAFFNLSIRKRILYTGNPVRLDILNGNPQIGKNYVGCDSKMKLILVLGGSLGSVLLNKLISESIFSLTKHFFIVHQTGARHFTGKTDLKNYFTTPFIKQELPHILAAADLVISRAGANSLWEFSATGTPSLLIPLSTAGSRGDQLRNAQFFKLKKASVVLLEEQATGKKLVDLIEKLFKNKKTLLKMSQAAQNIYLPNSASQIANILIKIIKDN